MKDQSLDGALSQALEAMIGDSPLQPRSQSGRFSSPYSERRGKAIALRLPHSLDTTLRQMVGWRSKADNASLKAWVEAAILEKLERQQRGEGERGG